MSLDHHLIRDRVSEVLPGFLFIGNMLEARSEVILKRHKVTHVLTVSSNVDRTDTGLTIDHHLIIPEYDNIDDLLCQFSTTFKFIEDAKNEKGAVLIHGAHGMSRAPTIAAAYLIKKESMTAKGALDVVRKARPGIHISPPLLQQLDIYECAYDSSPSDKVFASTKKGTSRHRRPLSFLKKDVTVAFAERIYMREPCIDPKEAAHLLKEMRITHIVGTIKPETSTAAFCYIDYTFNSLLNAAAFIDAAIREDGVVLIYENTQDLAWASVCTYFVTVLNLRSVDARSVLETAREVHVSRR